MAETIKQTEAIPAEYPDVTPFNRLGHIDEVQDAPVSVDQVWQRIESYIAHRFTARAVIWIVEADGGDTWEPPLTPVVSISGECWNENSLEWEAVSLVAGPVGYVMTYDATYRITATVGGGDVPAAVQEAFKRMHEYTRGINDSFKNETAFVGGEDGIPRGWTAKAMQLCGAADLLRPYRRA